MSIHLKPVATELPVSAVRTDETKRALLRDAVQAELEPVSETAAAILAGQALDIYEIAVSIRAALPDGLEHGDFDGTDIGELITAILAETAPPPSE